MGNMTLYEKFRVVPEEAKKKITGGRLNGKTDINPMWRIKMLTEEFGPAGIGWYAPITEKWTENGANGEITANIRINLFVKADGGWSQPIEGIGGSLLIAKESGGLKTDDDAFKKAYTDAISVACKALGIGADVYYEKDPTKYQTDDEDGSDNGNKQPQKTSGNGAKSNAGNKVVQGNAKKELCAKYGISDYETAIASYEKRLGNRPFEKWTAEERQVVEEDMKSIQKRREEKKQRQARLSRIDDDDIPFPMEDS